jgi:hypothetical protein
LEAAIEHARNINREAGGRTWWRRPKRRPPPRPTRKHHGIWELEDDTLRQCGVAADKKQPKAFTTSNKESLFVFKRVQP